jgi:hypothetical protein
MSAEDRKRYKLRKKKEEKQRAAAAATAEEAAKASAAANASAGRKDGSKAAAADRPRVGVQGPPPPSALRLKAQRLTQPYCPSCDIRLPSLPSNPP